MKLTVAYPFAVPARTLVVLVMGASLGGVPRVAHSQTTPPNENTPIVPKDANPTNDAPPAAASAQAPKSIAGYGFGRGDGAPRQSRQNIAERRMRDLMTRNGIEATTTQDAILTFLRDDEVGKKAVRDAGRRLWNGMRRDVPAERLRALLTDYQKALESERKNRERAQTALDARVGYSLNARLESMLWLLGVLGEGQNILAMSPQWGPPRGPRGPGNNMAPFGTYGVPVNAPQFQVEGVVNAKNAPEEAINWLEIRDATGRLWRMVPSSNPDAQPILNRQIGGLVIGTHVLVRLVTPPVMTPATPYSLVALVPATEAGKAADEGGDEGAGDAPGGQ